MDRLVTAPGFQRPPIKVVMVVDNSATFANLPAAQKAQLEDDLKDWLNPPNDAQCTNYPESIFCRAMLYGTDVAFHILTTTQEAPSAQPVATRVQTCSCTINKGSTVYPVDPAYVATSYTCNECDAAVNNQRAMSYEIIEKNQLLPTNPLATTTNGVIEFKYTSDSDKAESQAKEIQTQVWNHFRHYLDASRADMGDSATRGICTLARVLRQRPAPELQAYYYGDLRMTGPTAPLVKGDRALFMLFSNQDDETSDSDDCFMYKRIVRRWQDDRDHTELPKSVQQVKFDSPPRDMVGDWKHNSYAKFGEPKFGYTLATFLNRSDDTNCKSFPGEIAPKYETLTRNISTGIYIHGIEQSLCSPDPDDGYKLAFEELLNAKRATEMIVNSVQYTALAPDYRIVGVTHIKPSTPDTPSKSTPLEICDINHNWRTCDVVIRHNSLGFKSAQIEITNDTKITLKLEKFALPPKDFTSQWAQQNISTNFGGTGYSSSANATAIYERYRTKTRARFANPSREIYYAHPYGP